MSLVVTFNEALPGRAPRVIRTSELISPKVLSFKAAISVCLGTSKTLYISRTTAAVAHHIIGTLDMCLWEKGKRRLRS